MKTFIRLALLAALLLPLSAHAQVYFPYTIDFEDDTSGWQFVSNSSTGSYWIIDSAANRPNAAYPDSAGRALYVTSDSGATVSYNHSNQVTYAVKTLTFAEAGDYTLSFDWTSGGESTYDYFHVAIAPASATLPTGYYSFTMPSDWHVVASSLNLSASWQTANSVFSAAAGSSYKLVFVWRNDGSMGDGIGAAIDNIVINQLSCSAPLALTFDTASLESLTVRWNRGGTENEWQVMVGDSLCDPVYDTFTTIYGLNHSSAYTLRVRAICGSGDTSFWSAPVQMFTECAAVDTLPWFTDFENVDDYGFPLCWSRPLTYEYLYSYTNERRTYPAVYNYAYYAHSGSKTLHMYYYPYYDMTGADTNVSMAISPYFQHDPTDFHIRFFARFNLARQGSYFVAGLMTDPSDLSTFIPLDTVTVESEANGTMHEFNFYTEGMEFDSDVEGLHVAFFLHAGTGSSYTSDYVYLDDLMVNSMPTCRVPSAGTIDSISYEAVALSWTTTLEAEAYDVMLISIGDTVNDTTHHAATNLSLLINGLAANTSYEAYVAAVCGDDTTDYRALGSFTTDLLCYPPQNLRVSAVTANAAAIAWNWLSRGQERTTVEVVLTDLTDPTATPQTFTVSGSVHTFTGLTLGHLYEATLYTVCGINDSASTASIRFMPHYPACAEYVSTPTTSTTGTSAPIYGYYANSYSQVLYPDSLVAGIDSLNGIAYNAIFTGNMGSCDYKVDVYIGRRTGLYPSTYTQYPVPTTDTTMRKVLSEYEFSVSTNGWVYIPFDTAYAVGNTSDSTYLVVTVVNSSASAPRPYNSWVGQSRGGYNDQYYQGLYQYVYSGNTPVDPATTNANGITFVPDIQFFGTCNAAGACTAPSVQVVDADEASVSLNWLPGGSETSWQVEYSPVSATPAWTVFATGVTSANVTVTGLTSGTDYYFRVASLCGTDTVYSSSVSASTSCLSISVPTSVSFLMANRLPNCWETIGNSAYTSSSGFEIYNSTRLVSPEVDGSISDMMVHISTLCYGQNLSYRVGVCDADGSNLTWIATVPTVYWYDNSQYGDADVYFNAYTGTGKHIVIGAPSGYNYVYIRSVDFLPLPSCLPVISDVVTDTATATSATLSWISQNSNFEVQYRPYGDTTAAWTSAMASDTTVTISGLLANTLYDGRIRSICAAGDSSIWKAFQFASACVAYAAPYREDFDSTLRALPLCWSNVSNSVMRNSGASWSTSATYGYSYIYSYTYSSTTAADDWLISPEITITPGIDSIALIYDVATVPDYESSTVKYEVRLSTTGADTSDFTTLLLTDTANTHNVFETRRIALDSYVGQTVRFAIRNLSGYYGYVYLDNLGVRTTVTPEYHVYGNGVTFVGDTTTFRAERQQGVLAGMTYSWTSSMAAAGQATILNPGTDSIAVVYSASGVDSMMFIATNAYGADTVRWNVHVFNCTTVNEFPFTESFEAGVVPCWTLVYGDGNPSVNPMQILDESDSYFDLDSVYDGDLYFRFSSYSTSSNYNQYLISPEMLGTGRTVSFRYAMYGDTDSLRFGYSATGTDSASFTWVTWLPNSDQWAEYTFNLPDSARHFAIHYWGNYRYYAYIDAISVSGTPSAPECDAPVVTLDTVLETSATVSVAGTAASYEAAAVAGEWVAPASGTAFSGSSFTFTDLLPGTAYTLAVRAICDEGATSNWVTVSVTTLEHPCFVPTAVTVSDVTFNSAVVSWTPGENETQWQVNVTGPSYDQTFNANTNPYALTGLASGETYTVRVRALCSETQQSDWSETAQFTTERCQPVTGVTATATTFQTATVSWNPASNGSGNYEVEYGLSGFRQGDGTRVTVTGATTYSISGLDAETSYDIYVRSICSANLTSEWSPVSTFTTPQSDGIQLPTSDLQPSIYPNPATTTVTLTGLEPGATVTIVDLNGREISNFKIQNSKFEIDVTSYASGAYFVRITGQRQQAVRKLVVK